MNNNNNNKNNNVKKNPFAMGPMNNNNNNGGQMNNPYAAMFGGGQGGMYQPQPLGAVIKKWVKTILFILLFISLIQGCAMDGTGKSEFWQEIVKNDEGNILTEVSGLTSGLTFGTAWEMSGFFGIFFVWPLLQLAYLLHGSFNGIGINFHAASFVTIFVIVILVKSATLVLSWKNIKQQSKMQDLQIQMAEIKAKYAGANDPASKQAMQMEIIALYRKNDINPLGMFGTMFISMPMFFAMYKVIGNTHLFKVSSLTGFSYGANPGINGDTFTNYPLVIILVFVAATIQGVSMMMPQIMAKRRRKNQPMDPAAAAQLKQQRNMMIIMIGVLVLVVFNLPLGLVIYWIFTGSFQIFQTIITQKAIHSKKNKKKTVKVKK